MRSSQVTPLIAPSTAVIYNYTLYFIGKIKNIGASCRASMPSEVASREKCFHLWIETKAYM